MIRAVIGCQSGKLAQAIRKFREATNAVAGWRLKCNTNQ